MSFKVPEQYRYPLPGRPSTPGDLHGCFMVPAPIGATHVPLRCIASSGEDWGPAGLPGVPWEHVSVSPQPPLKRAPTWAEMCMVKDLFWDEEDLVIQIHPPRSEYVNWSKNCLHLWRPVGVSLPLPPSVCVGPVKSPDGGSIGRPDDRAPVCLKHPYGCALAASERKGPCVRGEHCKVLFDASA